MSSSGFSKSPVTTRVALALILAVLGSAACTDANDGADVGDTADGGAETRSTGPRVVELTAVGLQFEGPDTVPAGWTTLQLNNESELVHFAIVTRYPGGRGVAEHQAEVAPVFQEGMDLLNAGEQDAAMAKFGELPEWFGEMETLGGPGFVAGGRSAAATMNLEPGTYVIECYVKTGGVFHSVPAGPDTYGMVHELTVTDGAASGADAGANPGADAGAQPGADAGAQPEATIRLSISGMNGITVDSPSDTAATVAAGDHRVRVDFVDQAPHEHFLGHDVHVARLGEGADVEVLAAWMDWRASDGLETPAPAEFIGGIQEMGAGETGYFDVVLEPGEYAWIAEVPNPAEKGMLRRFTVE